jgi:chemotaxis protein MotB
MADEENNTPESESSIEESIPAGPPEEAAEEVEEGAPRWMATFADMVTLLMCFFVLLFAMSSTQQESFKELIKSLKSALGVQQVPEAGTREGLTMHQIPEEAAVKEAEAVDEAGGMVQQEINDIVTDVRELIMFNQLGGMVKVEGDETGAVITISDVVLFPAGSATMSAQGLRIMKKIANVLSQFRYHIKIAGHTDTTPIKTALYPSNWELSADRACEVVRFLVTQGINPQMMSAVGYSEYYPIATNDTREGRSQNRRVEIIYERQAIERKLNKANFGLDAQSSG